MITFRRSWVEQKLDGLWEEMSGVRRTFPRRFAPDWDGRKPDPTSPDLTYAREWIPFSELKAARLIQHVMEDRVTHLGDSQRRGWHFFNEVYHEELDLSNVGDMIVEAFADQMVLAMDQVSQMIEAQAQTAQNPADERKRLKTAFRDHYAFQQRLHSSAGIAGLRERFQSQCSKPDTYFDNDRRWLVFMNGVLDLEGFRKNPVVRENMRSHNPALPVKRAVACDFNPDAKAPNWEHFLETSIPDEEVRAFLQRLVGAAFLAESKVKAIPNLQGPRDCGKTIFVTTLERLAGGYGIQPSPDSLMQQPGGGTNFEQDTLRGARFVGISEPSATKRLDDTFCKQITGGDEVRTRGLHKSSTPWLPQCVIFIASNHPVNFFTEDQAFVDRVCLIEFPHQFFDPSEAAEGEIHIKDYELEEKLAREYEGIFLWVIKGMWEYLVHGIGKPESVKMAGDRFVTESSSSLSWIEEKVTEGLLAVVPDVHSLPMTSYVTLGKLYSAYANEMRDVNEKPVGKRRFTREVANKFPKDKSGQVRLLGLMGTGSWAYLNDENSVSGETWNGIPIP